MAKSDIRSELEKAPHEPLLPIEKKLIAGSFSLGIVILLALLLVQRFMPI
jgi:hypothetical protein